MKKIIVIGCPGSGKSTFARTIQEKTGINLYYLDMIWHNSDRTNVTKEEFDARLSEILEKDSWIIDGNYQRTMPMRLEKCDTVFLLDFPTEICIQGAESRIGKPRADMPWIELGMDEEFRQYILEFAEKNLPQIYKMLELYPEKEIIIFRSREEVQRYLELM